MLTKIKVLQSLRTFVRSENPKSAFDGDAMAAVLVIRAKPCGVCAECRLSLRVHLFQRVLTLAIHDINL
ncbi:hypothetical protein LSM04_002396 [Trypanosoma melophagium]|uniref:uncharacterized protein n=1 Tax=Trypanosoma melophagium TaxID=715481 RepID=UPI003519EC10|nr:hypothetical protein LSM04_002396 [Trypanosoma melophagium]